jgi:hypothetical protein
MDSRPSDRSAGRCVVTAPVRSLRALFDADHDRESSLNQRYVFPCAVLCAVLCSALLAPCACGLVVRCDGDVCGRSGLPSAV